jgi:hypothetical protein
MLMTFCISFTFYLFTGTGARTSLFIPALQILILAERANSGKPASLTVFKLMIRFLYACQ